MVNDSKSFSKFTTTRIGNLNRQIEKNTKAVVSGRKGATGTVIATLKKRQALLESRNLRTKEIA